MVFYSRDLIFWNSTKTHPPIDPPDPCGQLHPAKNSLGRVQHRSGKHPPEHQFLAPKGHPRLAKRDFQLDNVFLVGGAFYIL